MEEKVEFVVKVPLTRQEMFRIVGYIRDGYRLVHDLDEQEQTEKSKGAGA